MAILPKVSFCNHDISKLLIGDNPIYGYSHFNKLLSQQCRICGYICDDRNQGCRFVL